MKLLDKIKKSFKTRAFHSGTTIFAIAAAAVVLALIVNLIVGALPDAWTKLDTTRSEIYSVSPAAKKLLASLDEEVEIYCIAESGAEDKTLQELLNRFADLSERVKVKYIDPVLYPTFTLAYTEENLPQNSMIVKSGARFTIASYDDVFVYEMNYDTYAYDAYFDGESLVTGAIDFVTRANLPTVYCLMGHGEDELGTTISSAAARQNIDVQELSLLTTDVPEDCQCLIIVSPDRDISEDEAEKIEKYVENGGNILLFTTYTEEAMPNLVKISAAYGAELMDGIVVDSRSGYSLSGYPHYLVPSFGEHEITAPMTEEKYYCLTPISQAIRLADELPEGVSVTPLLLSSEESYIKVPNEYVVESYDYAEGDVRGSFPLAIAAEKDGKRFVWITSTYMLEPDFDSLVSGANTDFVLNSLNWMTEREDAISISPKSVSVEYLATATVNTTFWAVVLIGILPLGVLAAGITVAVKRKRR